jgi:hypothetical protein
MMSMPTPSTRHPVTDAEKLTDALRAGPKFITTNATVLDWPAAPGGEYRVLRQGTSQWTCLPGVPGYSHDEPGCFDPAFMTWLKELEAFSHDGSNGQPYVAHLPNGHDLYLVMPFREWPQE